MIPNCAEVPTEFNDIGITSSLICKKCDEEYYKSDIRCLKGNVRNCKENQGKNLCVECKEGFFKINSVKMDNKNTPSTGTTNRDYCIKIPEDLGCKEVEYVNDLFSCKNCKNLENRLHSVHSPVLDDYSSRKSWCFSLVEIPNCKTYFTDSPLESISDLNKSNFSC